MLPAFVLTGLSRPIVIALAVSGGTALTALYLLGRQRRRIVVPFLSLWVTSGAEGTAHRLARRLRRVVSLLLQLAIFTAVLLAAADPRPATTNGGLERTVVVLIDRSASMRARDETGSRLARARELARDVVRGLGPQDSALIASFAAQVSAATGLERDQGRLVAAIDGIEASDETGDLEGALAFSAMLLRGRPHPTLVLIGDGGHPEFGDAGDVGDAGTLAALKQAGVDLRFVPVGRRANNLGIVAFTARRLPAERSAAELVLVTQNFRETEADVSVSFWAAGSARLPLARRRVHLPAHGRVATTVTVVAIPDPRLEALLENTGDDLSLDDRAYAIAAQPPPLRVLVVGRRNLYLEGALLGMSAPAVIDHVPGEAAEESRSRWMKYDVVIFDGVVPLSPPSAGRFLFLDPHGPGSPWPDAGVERDPVITEVVRDHPVVRQLALMDLNVLMARRLTLAAGDLAIARSLRTSLIVTRTRPDLRAIGVAFDVKQSDLPLRSAFPLFVSSALGWLAARNDDESWSWPTGRTVTVPVAAAGVGASAGAGAGAGGTVPVLIAVATPDGRVVRSPALGGRVTLVLDRTGFFTLAEADAGQPAYVAANLASPSESDLTPRPQLTVGGRTLPLPDQATGPGKRRQPWWRLGVWMAVALLMLEWTTFHRRLTV